MNQRKIGAFLKELRKEKSVTQEQLAEVMRVSRRTVSRWETGSNMPDLAVLIDMADYYGVDVRELLDGERKGEHADTETKETVLKVADYSTEEKLRITKQLHRLFVAGLCFFAFYLLTLFLEPENPSALFDFTQGMCLGVSFGMVVVGVIMTSRYAQRIRAFKMGLLRRG